MSNLKALCIKPRSVSQKTGGKRSKFVIISRIVDRFYVVLFAALQQTDSASVCVCVCVCVYVRVCVHAGLF